MKSIDKDVVLRTLASRSMHLTELCEVVGIPKNAKSEMLDVLMDLRSLGLVKELPGQRFRIAEKKPQTSGNTKPSNPNPKAGSDSRGGRGGGKDKPLERRPPRAEVEGRFTAHVRGFGFIATEDESEDVFVAPGSSGGAMHGDRVRAKVRPGGKGREGLVVEILQRGTKRLTGTVIQAKGESWLAPDDARFYGAMRIKGEIPEGAKPGVTVVAEFLKYPTEESDFAEVAVLRTLGKAGLAEVEVLKLKIRDGIIEEFPPEVLEEAKLIPDHIPEEEAQKREDLRHLDLVTIDPPDARDHDDAVWAEKRPDGTYRIVIAIADVSHYVRPGTAIDKEAAVRGFTIYLPDRAIPMLPREISSTMASLVPDVDRLTLAVEVEMNPQGGITSHRFIEGIMRSRARLTYQGVAQALGYTNEPTPDPKAKTFLPLLKLLADISGLLNRKRVERGSLNFDLPEPRVKLNEENNEPLDVYRSKEDPGIKKAYSMVEELMLLANEVVGTELSVRKIPALFRIHGKPDGDKIALFIQLAESLGHTLDEDAIENPKKLAAFLLQLEGTPHSGPLGYLLLRAMQQATYDVNNVGHFALAAPFYLHFTSPIRRYPDLCVHRTVRDVIRGVDVDVEALRTELGPIGRETSRLERRAMVLERDVVNLYRCILVRERIGEDFHGTVTGVGERGVYVSLDAPFVELFMPLERLPGTYELNELGTSLVAKGSGFSYTLGDPIDVRIEAVSLENREVRGAPVAVAEAGGWVPPSETVEERRFGRPGSSRGGNNNRDERGARNRQGDRKEPSRRAKSFKGKGGKEDKAKGRSDHGGGGRAGQSLGGRGFTAVSPGDGRGPAKGHGGRKKKTKRAK